MSRGLAALKARRPVFEQVSNSRLPCLPHGGALESLYLEDDFT